MQTCSLGRNLSTIIKHHVIHLRKLRKLCNLFTVHAQEGILGFNPPVLPLPQHTYRWQVHEQGRITAALSPTTLRRATKYLFKTGLYSAAREKRLVHEPW